MNPLKNIFTLTFLSLFIMGCESEKKEVKELEKVTTKIPTDCPKFILKNKKNNLNISVLLDLSDRIEKKNTVQKDSAYLSSLAKVFVNHVKGKKLILLEDRMQLFFNPVPNDTKINQIAEKLKVQFTKDTHKEDLDRTISLYSEYPSQLYDLAQKDAQLDKKYPGSDIWGFFKYHVNDYCIDACHRNILVILTDGFMYHENTIMKKENRTSYITSKSLKKIKLDRVDWKEEIRKRKLGFLSVEKEFKDLEVLVIGISDYDKSTPYARDILEVYWSDWFESMNIKNYKIKSADIPSSIEKVIFDFIKNK
ncbi:hypothetical protein RQM59_06525 [Flavobacteriaceae bacterium S356]|uniref:VWFA domain-containing protein n=1 Tax=Asprobacillus argus TaxID=3076534 RepID=A0ABU3LE88_9FLAO|nr:hypothetical protein [Flavobacteriaceae bacterium S356]